VLVELTDAGRDLLHGEVQAREAWLARRLAELADEDREVLRAASAVIDKLVASE
jgi:DNA-binding MarR family transcriptional regulator